MPKYKRPQPKDASNFLKRKKVVITDNWDDLKLGEHSHAFTVAHCDNINMLNDIFGLLQDSIDKGESYETFRKEMLSKMKNTGWYGRNDKEGDEDYANWRISVMHMTNMITSYSAGEYRQMMRQTDLRPYWVYRQRHRKNKRKEHEPLDNTALPYNDPFWEQYDPPNGYGCQCYKESITKSQYENGSFNKSVSPNFNPANVPPKWKYSPGREMLAPDFSVYKQLAAHKMNDGKTALNHVKKQYVQEMKNSAMSQGEWETWSERVLKDGYHVQNIQVHAANLEDKITAHLKTDPKIIISDKALRHSERPGKPSEKALTHEDFFLIPARSSNPDSIFREIARPERFHFVSKYDENHVIRLVYRKKQIGTSFQYITGMIVPSKNEYNEPEVLEKLY